MDKKKNQERPKPKLNPNTPTMYHQGEPLFDVFNEPITSFIDQGYEIGGTL